MHGSTLSDHPPALKAFMRGAERRALALAEALCGDLDQARPAVAAAGIRFRHEAPGLPMADWPLRYWAALAARTELHAFRPRRGLPAAYAPLAELSPGARATLLLRLAAGLDVAEIAKVLDVSEAAARLALVRAMRSLGDGEDGASALPPVVAALKARIHGMPAAPADPVRAGSGAAFASAAGWLPRLLWGALALVAVLFAGTFLGLPAGESLAPGELRDLPVAEVPAMSPEAAALASPDFELLADPEAALADDLAFHAWLAAQAGGGDAR